jgi:D-alanyl-D-alanine dipeptidase
MKFKYGLLLLLICLCTYYNANCQSVADGDPARFTRDHPGQLLIVLTDDWQSIHARLYGFGEKENAWKKVLENPVVIGKGGLERAKGFNLLPALGGSYKKEGDGCSPAGFFGIGPAFGYAASDSAKWIRFPYLEATGDLLCVDDSDSYYYNRLLIKDTAKQDWKSFEQMHRSDEDYRWGLFVQYNYPKTISGNGSCIFIHIWQNADSGTVGCTAMAESDILSILKWVDYTKHPILIQMPEKIYEQIYRKLGLPQIN